MNHPVNSLHSRYVALFGKLSLALVALALMAFTAGCSLQQTHFLSGNATGEAMPGAQISGLAHGGQQPIAGATVQLWAVGGSGYGSAATALLSSTCTTSDGSSTADANANTCNSNNTLALGYFTLPAASYTCPNPPSNSTLGSGNALVYMTVTGGNPGAGVNSNLNLVAPLGTCGTLTSSTFVFINEITTAAAAYALGQYYSPTTTSFGAPNTTQAQVGINNAFNTVNNLANTSNGTAITSQTLSNNGLSVTSTPESTKLIAVANILAACVNSTGGVANDTSSCGTLFGDVAPTAGTTPADTLSAAVYLSTNPTSSPSATTVGGATSAANMTALWGLISGSPAFSGGLSTQPADWTLGIQFTSNVAEGTSSPLNFPQLTAIDSNGNVWVLNANGSAHDNITELGPTGIPTQIALAYTSGQIRNMAIDTANNVYWATASSPSGFWKYNGVSTSSQFTTFGSAYGITVGPTNDIYISRTSSSCNGTSSYGIGELYSTTPADLVDFACSSTAPNNKYAAIDANNHLWFTQGSSAATILTTTALPSDSTVSSTCGSYPCTGLVAQPTYTTITGGVGGVPALGNSYGLAVGLGGSNVWFTNQSINTLVELTSTTTGNTFGSTAALNAPYGLAVDGAGHIWVTNRTTVSPFSISEFDNSGNILSPQTTGTSPVNVLGFQHSGLNTPWGIAVDPSGNVWVANNIDNATGTVTGGLFELVGAGAPTVTPIAQALNGTVNSTGHGIGQMP